jgi:16S rRNA processing protein RimM
MGELKLYPWSDSPQFLLPFATLYMDGAGKKPVKVQQMRVHKNMCLVKLEGVNNIAEARPYIGRTVYIARADADIGEGRVFVQDLLGAKVVHVQTGEMYGNITAVTHPGRHDVYEVTAETGDVFLFPAVGEFVEEIDVERGVVKVLPIDGMFEVQPERKQKGNAGEEQD